MTTRNFTFRVDSLPKTEATQALSAQRVTRADLSADQVAVFDAVMRWRADVNRRQYLKVGGYAGTGKTTLVAALALELESLGEQIAFAAFTGKAVNVMSRKLRAAGVYGSASTLHSLMYRPVPGANGTVTWEKAIALPCSMIVVDEASMVGAELWRDLLSYGLPILAVGDHGQLPPVGDSVVNLMAEPDLRLERIHRQAEGNPILSLAQWVRDGNSHLRYEPTDERVSFVKSFAEIAPRVLADANNSVAICYTNKTRVALNRHARKLLNRDGVGPIVDDLVLCLRNKKPIFNGMRGRLAFIEDGADEFGARGAHVEFADDGLVLTAKLCGPQFNALKTFEKPQDIHDALGKPATSWERAGMQFDYAWAMTCHKSQGSQFRDVVVIYEPLFRDADTRNRWMYTAVTRAAERLWLVRP